MITLLVRAIHRHRMLIGARVLMLAFQLVTTHDAASQSLSANQPSPVMERQHEIALALTSCPPALADKAGVYLVERSAHVKVRESQNGFTACHALRALPHQGGDRLRRPSHGGPVFVAAQGPPTR